MKVVYLRLLPLTAHFGEPLTSQPNGLIATPMWRLFPRGIEVIRIGAKFIPGGREKEGRQLVGRAMLVDVEWYRLNPHRGFQLQPSTEIG